MLARDAADQMDSWTLVVLAKVYWDGKELQSPRVLPISVAYAARLPDDRSQLGWGAQRLAGSTISAHYTVTRRRITRSHGRPICCASCPYVIVRIAHTRERLSAALTSSSAARQGGCRHASCIHELLD